MLLSIVVVVVLIIVVILAVAAMKPAAFSIQRAMTMQAPPDRIFPVLDDFHRWGEWSPWEKLDPAMQRTFSGAPSGKGAAYAWVGNSKAGQGRMEITGTTPPRDLTIQLDFLKPFESHNTTKFALAPAGTGTNVTWTMTGTSPFMMKVMGLFMNMDAMIGKDFEAGLANLKALVESR